MKIAVIGIGNIGGTLARKLRAAGHEVRVANSKGPEGVRSFAQEIGAIRVDARGAVDGAELVIVSIPFPAVATLPKDLFDGVPQSVPVVDTGNYYPDVRDPHIPELDAMNRSAHQALARKKRLWGKPPELTHSVGWPTGLLRQYLPKGVDISGYSRAQLNAVARKLNERPRKTLDFRPPAEMYDEIVASTG